MTDTNVVDQNCDIKAVNQLLELSVVLIFVRSKIHGESLRRSIVFCFNIRCEAVQLALGP